jgi:hypothetical protein
MKRCILAALAATLTTGCHSSGVLGENGLVRFSFVGTEPGASDTAPVAANSTLRVLLQHPSGGLGIDANTFTDLSLQARDTEGGDPPAVFPTGVAEYGVFFNRAGSYQLQAMQGSTVVDSVGLTARDADALAFVSSVEVTTDVSGGKICSSTKAVAPSSVTLGSNQKATLFLVPRSGSTGLLGLPELTATATNATLDTDPSSYATSALDLHVAPTQPGSPITITATDILNDLTVTVTIPTIDSAASCP